MTIWIKQWTTSATKLVGRIIKNADTFGVKVNLNYKGKDKFSTFVGGLATLLMTGILLQYFYNQMIKMVLRESTVINSGKKINNFYYQINNY